MNWWKGCAITLLVIGGITVCLVMVIGATSIGYLLGQGHEIAWLPTVPSEWDWPSPWASPPTEPGFTMQLGVEEPESVIITPQGLWLENGSFLAQDIGHVGRTCMFDGEVVRENEEPNDGVTDFVIFDGGSANLAIWQGTFYQYRSGLGYSEVLEIVRDRNIPDKFNTTPCTKARIWRMSASGGLIHVDTLNRSGTSPPPPTGAEPTAVVRDWTSLLGVPAARLENCPGEDPNACVHVKDGNPISLTVPSGYRYEGWTGSETISGNGPAELTVAGLTVRPN